MEITESDEDIPAQTVLIKDANVCDSISEYSYKFRVVTFHIRDLLAAIKHPKYTNTYQVKGVAFCFVNFQATVVNIDIAAKKTRYFLDDGTAAICCFFEDRKQLNDLKNCVSDRLLNLMQGFMETDLSNGTLQLFLSGRKMFKNIPAVGDLKLGDWIEIIGRFSIYNNKCYAFIDKYKTIDNDIDSEMHYFSEVESFLNTAQAL